MLRKAQYTRSTFIQHLWPHGAAANHLAFHDETAYQRGGSSGVFSMRWYIGALAEGMSYVVMWFAPLLIVAGMNLRILSRLTRIPRNSTRRWFVEICVNLWLIILNTDCTDYTDMWVCWICVRVLFVEVGVMVVGQLPYSKSFCNFAGEI